MSSFNGSGTFVISGTGLPFVTGTTISSTVVNQLDTDLATGLSTCITKDGQSVPTANIPMGGFKLTGLAVATQAGDALSYGNSITATTLTLSGALTYGGVTLTAAVTGTGNMVLNTSPTLVTPTLGVATATSVNGSSLAVMIPTLLTTGTSATFNTPTDGGGNLPRQLVVFMRGGGGGGWGVGTTTGTAPGAGGDAIFNSIHSAGGTAGNSNGTGGAGGTGGTGTTNVLQRIPGAPGGFASLVIFSGTNFAIGGGEGGGDGGGRNIAGSSTTAGVSAVANSGGGGGGASVGSGSQTLLATYTTTGGPGGQGEGVWMVINSPSSSYTYTVPAGGTAGGAGTGGAAGGAGGSGYITIYAYF